MNVKNNNKYGFRTFMPDSWWLLVYFDIFWWSEDLYLISLMAILMGLACVASCAWVLWLCQYPCWYYHWLFAFSYYPSPLMTISESVISRQTHTHSHIAEALPSGINCSGLSSSCRQATLISLIKKVHHGDCLSATHPLGVLSSIVKASSACDLSKWLCLNQVSF